ncbi:hypothetical protein ACYX7E_14685 [Luteimonas sp. RIT-PG2_3]
MGHVSDFIHSHLFRNFPPENPLVLSTWTGMAFDRNLYESFAPDDVWREWLSTHLQDSVGSRSISVAKDCDIDDDAAVHVINADLLELLEYWKNDLNFMSDHYVFSLAGKWIIRLDQDVTLFAGDSEFVGRVVNRLGGCDAVLARMEMDFSPGDGDEIGLGRYLRGLLRRSS